MFGAAVELCDLKPLYIIYTTLFTNYGREKKEKIKANISQK